MREKIAWQVSIEMSKLEQLAPLIRIYSHPLRLRIIDFLETVQTPQRVTEIVGISEGAQQAIVSQQLKILRDAGILEAERKGNCVYYFISNKSDLSVMHCIRKYADISGLSV